jgi:probable HAF family extracellular repeat protein
MTSIGTRARPGTGRQRRLGGAATAVALAASLTAGVSPAGAAPAAPAGPAAPGQAPPALEVDVVDIVGPDGQGFVPVEINVRGQVSGFVPGSGFTTGPPLLWQDGEVVEIAPGTNGIPHALNAWGEVVGTLVDSSGTTAFRWRAGRIETVPASQAVDVNELAQALRLERGTGATDVDLVVDGPFGETLVPLPEGPDSVNPVAVTNDGRVTGNLVDTEVYRTTAFTWDRRRGTTLIEAPGLSATTATASSDAGHVIGRATTVDGDEHAFIWKDGELTDLGSLYGGYTTVVRGLTTPADFAINASNRKVLNVRGQVVGTSVREEPWSQRGFLWDDGVMTDLGDLRDGCARVTPAAINNSGQVVGTCDQRSEPLAFLWQDGEMRELGPVVDVGFPVGINDRGQIITLGIGGEAPALTGRVLTVHR